MGELPEGADYATFAYYVCEKYVCENAQFPPDLWAWKPSVDMPRTTNAVEGFNRHYNDAFTGQHPNIHTLTDTLLDLQAATNVRMNTIAKNEKPTPTTRKRRKEELDMKVLQAFQDMCAGKKTMYSYLKFSGMSYSAKLLKL